MARTNMPSIAPPNTHGNTIELIAMELMVVSFPAFVRELDAWLRPKSGQAGYSLKVNGGPLTRFP